MKFLIVGDFHGRCTLPLLKIIEENEVEFILSAGDYCGGEEIGKLIMKYFIDEEGEITKRIVRKIKRLEKKGIRNGVEVVKRIKKCNVNFFGVRGNWDPVSYAVDIGRNSGKSRKNKGKKLEKFERDNFRFVDFKMIETKEFVVIGGGSSTHSGKIDKKTLKTIEKEDGKSEVRARVKEYERRKKIYVKNFLRAKKKNKPIIFVTHNCPYETKLDVINRGEERGKHYGSYLDKEIIRRFKPDLVICGHMHENQGKDKLGKSIIVNAGAALENKYAIIDFDMVKKEVKRVKFFTVT